MLTFKVNGSMQSQRTYSDRIYKVDTFSGVIVYEVDTFYGVMCSETLI